MAIFHSATERIDSRLADIEGTLQYDLFENELDAATDLRKKKHIRAAGALAGVTLETHLRQVTETHQIKLSKKDPTISEYNDALKSAGVIDVPTWRYIQRLGDIRNLSAHAKDREPTDAEIIDLIEGVRKMIATVN